MERTQENFSFSVLAATVFCLFLLMGCGPSMQSIQDRMDSQIGVLTYDQAINRWGPPYSVIGGSGVWNALWSVEAPPGACNTVLSYLPPGFTGGYPMARSIRNGEALRITFDKTTRFMVDWSYRRW